jgi:hypothetical protein
VPVFPPSEPCVRFSRIRLSSQWSQCHPVDIGSLGFHVSVDGRVASDAGKPSTLGKRPRNGWLRCHPSEFRSNWPDRVTKRVFLAVLPTIRALARVVVPALAAAGLINPRQRRHSPPPGVSDQRSDGTPPRNHVRGPVPPIGPGIFRSGSAMATCVVVVPIGGQCHPRRKSNPNCDGGIRCGIKRQVEGRVALAPAALAPRPSNRFVGFLSRMLRTELCAGDEVQLFHLINRCVRRTFLACGRLSAPM